MGTVLPFRIASATKAEVKEVKAGPRHTDQHPSEPVLGFRLQRAGIPMATGVLVPFDVSDLVKIFNPQTA